MTARPLLLLDAAGVLLQECDRHYLELLAVLLDVPPQRLEAWFQDNAYEPWWSGRWTFNQLCQQAAAALDGQQPPGLAWLEQAWGTACARRLAAAEQLPKWAQQAELWLLSDHRSTWLEPGLGQDRACFARWLVSDQLGYTKRHPDCFARVAAAIPGAHRVIYVDDREENLRAAARAIPGCQGLLAAPETPWQQQLSRLLRKPGTILTG